MPILRKASMVLLDVQKLGIIEMEFKTVINPILLTAGIAILIPCLVFFLECFAAFISSASGNDRTNLTRPKTTVLIPAHNEAAQIKEVIEDLQTQLTQGDRVIVIADNCHDNTAELARSTGVTVLERENKTERGKGYALDYAMQQIRDEPPEVLVILDGDCLIAP
ncbi:MAG: glycosyltransferase family 2 protein, partial [Cyanobacteria bacterium J06649_11]